MSNVIIVRYGHIDRECRVKVGNKWRENYPNENEATTRK